MGHIDDLLTPERKEQLVRRVKEAVDEDILNVGDWLAIYDILVKANERKAAELYEQYVEASIEEGLEGGEEE